MAELPDIWIPVTQAVDRLAERYFDHVAQYWEEAYPAAWRSIERAMASGEASTRAAHAEWQLLDASGGSTRNLEPQPEGALSNIFWHHFSEAKMIHSDGLVTIADGPGSHHAGNDFWFLQQTGLVDDLQMEGLAEGVEILEASIPNGAAAKRRRGRPKGPKYSDETVIKRVVAAVNSGIDMTEAINQFAPDMDGGGDLRAKKARLRQRLNGAELREPRQRKNTLN